MTKEQFMELVTKKLKELLDKKEYRVHCETVTKNNGTKRHCIIVSKKGETIAPTIYVDHFYQDYIKGQRTQEEITEQIMKSVRLARSHVSEYRSLSLKWETCKEQIIFRLISHELNTDTLEIIPHMPFLDLAVVFVVVCNITALGVECIQVTNEMMKQWGIETKDLMEMALQNTPRLFPFQAETLDDMIVRYMDADKTSLAPARRMMIFSNRSHIHGASVLLYPNLIQTMAEEFDVDLYVLPSSIHEIIVMPDDGSHSLEELSALVGDINKSHVEPDEILSDHAYLYDHQKKEFLF